VQIAQFDDILMSRSRHELMHGQGYQVPVQHDQSSVYKKAD